MKLIIFDETKSFPYLQTIFVILERKKWVKTDNFQNFTKGLLGERFEDDSNCQSNLKCLLFQSNN